MFEIPIVLFIFKRMKILKIVEQISKVKPNKIYLMADYGRTEEEKILCDNCRDLVEKAITWECEVVKNYATENRGVYGNIGLGAKWIFEREERAIFLEDDNFPEVSFFEFCRQMLYKYENEDNILWICGTNYLKKYDSINGDSYMFTRHMLPCGWASWAHKFNKYYDGNLENLNETSAKVVKRRYVNSKLATQFERSWTMERYQILNGQKPTSWDFQMDFSLKYFDKLGISPRCNLIKNIGVDMDSIHGGYSMQKVMTKRFCEIECVPIFFPLTHPKKIEIDRRYEKKIGKVLLFPLKERIRTVIIDLIKRIFKINKFDSFKSELKNRKYKKNQAK